MKRNVLFVLCCILCWSSIACKPTPETDVIVNKREGHLQSVIKSMPVENYTMESERSLVREEKEASLREALGAPVSVNLDITGPVYGGMLHIEADAVLHMPDVSRVPVLRMGRLHPSAADKQRIAETMTGRTVFFGSDPLGNERFLNVMEQENRTLVALDDTPYGTNADYEGLQAKLAERIQQLLRYYNETKPGQKEPWVGSWGDDFISIFTENGQHIWIETESKDTCSIQYDASDANVDGAERVIDEAVARRLVEDALDVFGASHYKIVDIHPADRYYRELFNSETGIDDGSFTVSIRPMYEGIPIFGWDTYFGSDTAAQKAGLSYAHPVVKERLYADVKLWAAGQPHLDRPTGGPGGGKRKCAAATL